MKNYQLISLVNIRMLYQLSIVHCSLVIGH